MRKLYLHITLLLFVAGLLTACNLLQPAPELEWDESPQALIVRATVGGGLIPQAAAVNDLPRGQVWGDGRVVWTTFNDRGERQVWQGQLSRDELAALLEEFAGKGFWRLDDFYEPRTQVFDSATTSLTVNLLSESKTVSEYHEGAPAAFGELVRLLSSGAGAEASPYTPASGFLTAIPMPAFNDDPVPDWDAAALGVDLAQAGGGLTVEGPALLWAWQLVNLNQWGPRVQQGAQQYELMLNVPELTGR